MPQTRPSAIRSRARFLKYTQNRILIPWVDNIPYENYNI